MARGVVLVAEGVDDLQLAYAYHRLREDAVLVEVASVGGGAVTGEAGTEWETIAVADLDAARRYDLVVIPDGQSVDQLGGDGATAAFLAAHLTEGGVVCAIAAGALALAATGVVEGRLVTGFEGGSEALAEAGAVRTDEAVTIDGTIVTVRDADALPYGIAAAMGSVAIPQDPAAQATERPRWEETDAD